MRNEANSRIKFLALKKTIAQLKNVSKGRDRARTMADLEQGRLSGHEEKLNKYLVVRRPPYDNLVAAAKIKYEKEKFAEAIEYCHRAINLADQLPQAPGMPLCYRTWGRARRRGRLLMH